MGEAILGPNIPGLFRRTRDIVGGRSGYENALREAKRIAVEVTEEKPPGPGPTSFWALTSVRDSRRERLHAHGLGAGTAVVLE
jgi:hypothetical protein